MDDSNAAELYRKHRPKGFKGIVGQDEAVGVLTQFLAKQDVPHALLLTGPSGCGKTTLARILRRKMGCADPDFFEINAADFRGIDTVRELRARAAYKGFHSGVRVWLIDECFPAGTPVSTPSGLVPIETLLAGDSVFTISGVGVVRQRFRNRVLVGDVVRVSFSDGTEVVTTRRHLFLTNRGWLEAQALQGACVFSIPGYTMQVPQGGTCDAMLSVVRKRVPEDAEGRPTEVLLQELRAEAAAEAGRQRPVADAAVCLLSCEDGVPGVPAEDVLRPFVPVQGPHVPAGDQSRSVQQRDAGTSVGICPSFRPDGEGFEPTAEAFRADEAEQPLAGSGQPRKGPRDEAAERHPARLEGGSGGQRPADYGTADAPEAAGRSFGGLGARGLHSLGLPSHEGGLRDQVRGRPGAPRGEASGRGGRGGASVEADYARRCQEDPLSRRVRVDRVTVYQPGDCYGAFAGAVSSQGDAQGFVEFFDLEVAGHPSYFVWGLPVHNCHALTKDSQSALLKLLEDAPDHAYYMLATTDPQKLLATVRTRCTEVKVRALAPDEVGAVLADVATKEGLTLTPAVVDRVVEVADGSARKALVLLHQVAGLPDEAARLDAVLKSDGRRQAIELARCLMEKKGTWLKVAGTLKGLADEDPEGLRRLVLAYAYSVLLGGGPLAPRAYALIDVFAAHVYDSGKAGLAARCYEVFGQK